MSSAVGEMQGVVFCVGCRNKKFVEAAMGCCGHVCKANPIPEHDSFHPWKRREQCEVKNRNNNCVDFVGTAKYTRGVRKLNKGENNAQAILRQTITF